jgi:hypothetical protein
VASRNSRAWGDERRGSRDLGFDEDGGASMTDVSAVVLSLGELSTERALASLARQTAPPADVALVTGEIRPFHPATEGERGPSSCASTTRRISSGWRSDPLSRREWRCSPFGRLGAVASERRPWRRWRDDGASFPIAGGSRAKARVVGAKRHRHPRRLPPSCQPYEALNSLGFAERVFELTADG